MKIFDLEQLSRDRKQGNLYNLFQPTFQSPKGKGDQIYEVMEEKNMRIDLVSNELYKTTDNLDYLMNLNEIDNPLNIMSGDKLFYTNEEVITAFRKQDLELEITRDELVDVEKQTKLDPDRQKYVEQGFSVIPTVNDVPKDPISFSDTRIIIGNT
jgi:hypothetical protein